VVVDLASRRVPRGGVRGRLSGWVPRTAVVAAGASARSAEGV